MEFDLFKATNIFIEKTYTEKMKDMAKSLSTQYNYFYINDLFENYVIVTIFDEETYEANTFRISFTSEEDNTVFGDKIQVYPRYLTAEEISQWEKTMNDYEQHDDDFEDESSDLGANEEENDFEEEENEEEKEEFEEENHEEENDEEESEGEFENETSVEDQQEGGTDEQELEEKDEFEEGQDDEEEQEEQEFSSTTLDSGERAELEALRKERKLTLVESFREDLSSDFIKEVVNMVDNFSYDELETTLSKEFTRIKKEEREFEKNKTVMNPLLINATKMKSSRESAIKALVEQYK